MIAKQIIFTGHVQGVGFRYTSCGIAGEYPVTGFVRNLADGTVEMFIQGSEKDIEACLTEIQAEFAGHIRQCSVTDAVPTSRYPGFEIR